MYHVGIIICVLVYVLILFRSVNGFFFGLFDTGAPLLYYVSFSRDLENDTIITRK